jgi:ATP-dependent exoDNAse (exonuclease V) alpha subunit
LTEFEKDLKRDKEIAVENAKNDQAAIDLLSGGVFIGDLGLGTSKEFQKEMSQEEFEEWIKF